mgnify:CR=1 FL=1
MIPKIIHFCWFGRGKMPEKAEACIESWKKFCPDYEIVEWNEDNFDINSNTYVKEAYENRKYAFVTDYVRLYAMYNYGGIYMDTDVEVLKSLDEFLDNVAFSGFESSQYIPTGIMASEKGFPLYKEFLDYYTDRYFVKPDGSLDTTTNVLIMSNIAEKHGLVRDGSMQILDGWKLYPSDYFCPLNDMTGKLEITQNTAVIHWFAKSWVSERDRRISKITKVFHKIFGEHCFDWLKKIIKR